MNEFSFPAGTARRLLAVALLCVVYFFGQQAAAQTIDTKAKEAFLVDFETGAVLFEKAADEKMYPASMTKMMTVYLLMSRLKDGSLSLDDSFNVSEKAWRKGGSKMFVEVGKQIAVEDLLRGIVVQSGNDATIVVAEALSGSEENFAREMTETAHRIGMANSNFRNASGWPDPDHVTTARDMATLATATIRDFPEMYRYYREKEFVFNGIKQNNRNPLLYRQVGADGLKTGHTEAAGFGLTASAIRDGRRLVLVVNGLKSGRERAEEAEKLLNWGFREWNSYDLFKAGDVVTEAGVWLGTDGTVPLVIGDDVAVTMRRRDRDGLRVTVEYEEPLPAPVQAGDTVAVLKVEAPGIATAEYPLTAGRSVAQLGPVGRLNAAFNYLVWGESQ